MQKEVESQKKSAEKEKFDLGKEAQAALKNAFKEMMIDSGRLGKEQTMLAVASDSESSSKKPSRSGSFCNRLLRISITTAFVAVVFFGVLMAIDIMFDRKKPTETIQASPLIHQLDDRIQRLSEKMQINTRMNHIPIYEDIIKDKLGDMNDRLSLVINQIRSTNQNSKSDEADMNRHSTQYNHALPKGFSSFNRNPQNNIVHTSQIQLPFPANEPLIPSQREPMTSSSHRPMIPFPRGHMTPSSRGPMIPSRREPMIPFPRGPTAPSPRGPMIPSPRRPMIHPLSRPMIQQPSPYMLRSFYKPKTSTLKLPTMIPVFSLSITDEDAAKARHHFLRKEFENGIGRFKPEDVVLTITVDEAINILTDVRQFDTIPKMLDYLSNTRIFHRIMELFRRGVADIQDYMHWIDDVQINPTLDALEKLSEDPSEGNLKHLISTGEKDVERSLELIEKQPGPLKSGAEYIHRRLRKFMKSEGDDHIVRMGKLFNQFKVMMPLMSSMASRFYEVLQSDKIVSDMDLITSDTFDLATELQKDGQRVIYNLMHNPRGKKLMKKVCKLLGDTIELLEQAREDSPGLALIMTANGNVEFKEADEISAETIALFDNLLDSMIDIRSEALSLGEKAVVETLQNPEVLPQIISKVGLLADDMDHFAVDLNVKMTGTGGDLVGTGLQKILRHLTSRDSPIAPLTSAIFSMLKPQKGSDDLMKAMAATIEKDETQFYEESEDNGMFTDLASSIMGNIYGEEEDILSDDAPVSPEEVSDLSEDAEKLYVEAPDLTETSSNHEGLIAFFNSGENASPVEAEAKIVEEKEIAEEAENLTEDPDDTDIEFFYTVTSKPGRSQLIDTSAKLSVID